MNNTVGPARRVTDAEAEIILAWARSRRSFKDWARIFGVSTTTIQNSLEAWTSPDQWNALHSSRSGPGRKRALSASQVETLLNWYRTRKTRRQLARELGLSDNTVGEVIKRGGRRRRRAVEDSIAMLAASRAKLEISEPPQCTGNSGDTRSFFSRLRAENAARFRAYLIVDNS